MLRPMMPLRPIFGRRALSFLAYTYSKGALTAQQTSLPAAIGRADVEVSFLACALSPYDQVKEGSVFGTSGVAVVNRTGSAVKDIQKGDRVVPAKECLGTWREVGVFPSKDVAVIPSTVTMEQAATLWSGPLTAVTLFRKFAATAVAGSVVITGAESAVGQALVQIAAARGLAPICIVDATLPGVAPVSEGLKYLGASVVVPDTYPIDRLRTLIADLGKPALGVQLNDGASSVKLLKELVPKKQICSVLGTQDLVEDKAAAVGQTFSQVDWMAQASTAEVRDVLEELAQLHASKKLITLAKRVPLEALPAEVERVKKAPLRTLVGVVSHKSHI